MRRAIETVPRDGKVVILEDDTSGTYELAQWSAEARAWVGENGELSKITPTHWHPMRRDKYQEEGGSSGPSTSRARGFLPFSSARVALQRPPPAGDGAAPRQVPNAAPEPVAVVEADAGPEGGPPALRRFAISSIAAAMVAASLIGMYFRSEVAAYVTLYAGQQDTLGIGTVGAQKTQIPSLDSQKTNSVARDTALQQQAEADRANPQGGWWDAAQVKQAAEATAPEAGQPLERELGRRDALANELARTGRDIDGRNLQQEGPAKAAQTLQQDREKTSALVQEVAAVREELRASAGQPSRELAQQRDRGETLASELARAQRDLETQVALSSKAGEEAAQVKQVAQSPTAELPPSLPNEPPKAH